MTGKPRNLIQFICTQLPTPFSISESQNNDFWHAAYTELKKSYDSSDFKSISLILTQISQLIEYQIRTPPKDLECQIVELFYKIITTFPIKSYDTQLSACFVFDKTMGNKVAKLKGKLTIPWKPLFDFAYFVLFKTDVKYLTSSAYNIENALLIAPDFSPLFPEGSTEEILEFFLPRISPTSRKAGLYMAFLASFLPVFQSNYKEWLPDYVKDINSIGSKIKMSPFFELLSRVIYYNMNEDFSFLLPVLINSFLSIIINELNPNDMAFDQHFSCLEDISTFEYITMELSRSLLYLCLSPPTQKAAIEQLTLILFELHDRYHPSVSLNAPEYIPSFVQNFVKYLGEYFIELEKENTHLPANTKPSQEIINQILKPIVDLHLMMIHTFDTDDHNDLIKTIHIIGELDPSSLSRYFEYGFQCITLTDAEYVAEQGWAVLTASLKNRKGTELFNSHIQEIFEMAVNYMAFAELQEILLSFFYAVFSIFPFNEELVDDELKNFPFEALAVKFISSILDAGRGFPALQGKFADVEYHFVKYTELAIQAFFSGCSIKTLAAVHPILESAISDHNLINAFRYFAAIYNYYFNVAEDEKKQSLLRAMEKVLLANPDLLTTKALLSRYLTGSMFSAKCDADFLKALEFVKPFLEHRNKKVRKAANYAIGNSFSFNRSIIIPKPTKNTLIPLKEFTYGLFEAKIDVNKISQNIVNPIVDQLTSIKDPTEFQDLLKEKRWLLIFIIRNILEVEEGELPNSFQSHDKNPFYIKELIHKDVPIRKQISKLILYAFDTFPDQVQILTSIFFITSALLEPIIGIYFVDVKVETERLAALWDFDRTPKVFNTFYLASLVHRLNSLRRGNYVCPFSPLLKEIFLKIIPYGFSKFSQLRGSAIQLIQQLFDSNPRFFTDHILSYLNRTDFDSVDEILQFFTNQTILLYAYRNEQLLCAFFRIICKKLRSDDQSTIYCLNILSHFFFIECFPYDVLQESSDIWDSLLSDLIHQVKKEAHKNRTLNIIGTAIITVALKHVKNVSNDIVLYLLDLAKVYDESITVPALSALITILRRKQKQTVEVKPIPCEFKLADYPVAINTKYPYNSLSSDEITPESFISTYHKQYIEPLNGSLNLIDHIRLFDKMSNGYHKYSKTYNIKHKEFWSDSLIIEHLPDLFMSSVFGGDETNVISKPYFCYFWDHVAKIIGPAAFKVLIPVFEELSEESMTEQTVSSLVDLITSFVYALPFYSDQDSIEFQDKILGPFLIRTSQNPLTSDFAQMVFILSSSSVSVHRLWPLLNFLVDNLDLSSNSSLSRRRLFDGLASMCGYQFHSFSTSVETLFKRFVEPYFDHYQDYNAQLASFIFLLYMILVEATSIPATSPKYSKEIVASQDFLYDQITKVMKNADPTEKSFHQFLIQFLYNLETIDQLALDHLVPIFIESIENILIALNTADVLTENQLSDALTTFLYLPYLLFLPDQSIEIIVKMIQHFDILSPPMQLKLLENFLTMLADLVTIITKEQCQSLYKLFLDLSGQIKNEDVLIKILSILGLILWCIPAPKEISIKEAEAFILNALIFDEVPDQIIKSFEIVSEAIENRPRNKTHLLQIVVNTFWKNNADHMLPKASEILEPYRLLVSASYVT